MNYYCTVYTETTWNAFAESHQPRAKSYQLRTMNERCHINSVPWMNAVTSTPYHEWTRSHQLRTMNARSLSSPSSHFYSDQLRNSWYGVGVTAFIHGTELMQFGKVTLRSTKICIKWLWPVKVTLEDIKRRTIVFCWSCDEGHLNWNKKNFRASSVPLRIKLIYSRPLHQMVGQCL
jgi:hypothetical protein